MSATTTNYNSLAGRRVLITGGASGIGAALVRAFVLQGSTVGFIDINKAAADEVMASLAGETAVMPTFLPCDLRNSEHVIATVDRFAEAAGGIDVLVNNAASDDRHGWEELTPADWDDRLNINLKQQFFAAQAAARHMQPRRSGSIINFTSTSWILATGGDMIGYATAKAGVVGMTRTLARLLGPHNIRCNAVAPGWIMTAKQRESRIDAAEQAALIERQCLKRLLYPDDVAPLVLFLGADDSAAITGQMLIADGGIA
ncbi:MAG: SDR family NAD(P)-dependent oxidoreductase [Ancalomicrobiaceae bacterium]|nr:SDR family NAD(P)-dependent oxidoreductase [Ancalomicrobiaceae bacterium]